MAVKYFFKENLAYESSLEFDFHNLEKIFDSIEYDNNTKTFSIQGNDIRFGLSSIKGISEKTMEKLKLFKSEQSSKFEVFQAAKEVGLSIGVLSALIQAGALDVSWQMIRNPNGF